MKTLLVAGLTLCGVLSAQTPVYRVVVTSRTAKAISYQHRNGPTKIGFDGTALVPGARGEASVEGKQGYIKIEADFHNLPEATQFGAEYLTYVLWAITPEGRTANLGEILRSGTSGKLNVTTELQAFGLIVTAEPYFAVSRPSDVVVMENIVRSDTAGTIEPIDAKYELLKRGEYEHLANALHLQVNRKVPLEMYEARNAIQIARASGAEGYAADTFHKAESNLKEAEAYQGRNAGSKPVIMTARQAVQNAEDARAIAVKRQDDDILDAERKAGADRELLAVNGRTAAQSETERVTREAADARSRAESEAARIKQSTDTQTAAAVAEADRLKRDNDAQRVAALTEADRLKQDSDAKLLAARSDLDRVVLDKAELRAKLLIQFNAILQTRDTARGLIVNMSDVLFDTGKFTLRPEAREKLAKVSGIVAGYPNLRLAVEGHTDSVGGDEYNQLLSEQRGGAVRDYLTQQGMAGTSVTAKGFGKTQPVASNDTTEGRQQNRRVELVISGEVIGTEIGTPIALR
jgi:outer membrane protein OmpA-like peptidoglycan-associated protein